MVVDRSLVYTSVYEKSTTSKRRRDTVIGTNYLARKVESASFSYILQLHKPCETFPTFRFVWNRIVLMGRFSLPKKRTAKVSFRKTAWLSRIQNRPNFFACNEFRFGDYVSVPAQGCTWTDLLVSLM